MIVKCQRSLATNAPAPQMLFYDRTRKLMWQGDLTPEWNRLFGPTMSPDDNRFFADVSWGGRKRPPTFVRRMPEQGW